MGFMFSIFTVLPSLLTYSCTHSFQCLSESDMFNITNIIYFYW